MSSPKIAQLQLLQQNMQNLIMQKQQFQNQIIEIDSALTELKTTPKAYKIVGKLMFASPKEQLVKELEQQKETAELRIKSLAQQEEKLQHAFEETQQEVMKELKSKAAEKKK
jgi:prefoldin beta subunit